MTDTTRGTMVAVVGATAGQPVVHIPRFAADPYPWGHGPDMNDGLRFSDSEVRLASPEGAS
jgi:hypothetical protein